MEDYAKKNSKTIKEVLRLAIRRVVKREVDRKLALELLTLAGITALALLLRWTASLQNGVSVFPDDDSYWHLEQQIVQFGHRLSPDNQAWLPIGRPETHPPLFHYAVAYTYLFLHYIGSGVSLFTVAYYSNLPAIILEVSNTSQRQSVWPVCFLRILTMPTPARSLQTQS